MRHIILFAAVLAALSLAGCDDPNRFRFDTQLVTDTLVLGAPSLADTLPSALDVVVPGAGTVVGRFPEREQDAEQFDVALRVRDGQLALVPAGVLGIRGPGGGLSRAGLTRALSQSFEALERAPARPEFVTDSAVVLREGAVYAIRSRQAGGCEYYGKLQPLEVRPAAGTVRLQVVANANCNDPRLVPED